MLVLAGAPESFPRRRVAGISAREQEDVLKPHLPIRLVLSVFSDPLRDVLPLDEAGAMSSKVLRMPGDSAHNTYLVLREADPLADIRNTRKIRAVIRRGRLLTRGDLDALLASGGAAKP